MWHDWLDNYEMNNPEKGQVLRNVVAYTVTGVFFLWILWYGSTHQIMDDPKFDDGMIEDGCWDFYSGLPNPSWYENDNLEQIEED